MWMITLSNVSVEVVRWYVPSGRCPASQDEPSLPYSLRTLSSLLEISVRTTVPERCSLVLPLIVPHWTNQWAHVLGGTISLYGRRSAESFLARLLQAGKKPLNQGTRLRNSRSRVPGCQNEIVPDAKAEGTLKRHLCEVV
jgi:hypothetical protein